MVANAGIAVTASLLETTAEQSQRTPDVNFTGVAHCYSAMPRKGTRPGSEMAAVVAAIPLGRQETPQDVAGVVSFLASPDAGYVTSQSIVVDGGTWLT